MVGVGWLGGWVVRCRVGCRWLGGWVLGVRLGGWVMGWGVGCWVWCVDELGVQWFGVVCWCGGSVSGWVLGGLVVVWLDVWVVSVVVCEVSWSSEMNGVTRRVAVFFFGF